VYQKFIDMYGSGCHICWHWSWLKPRFIVPAHRSTMSQINMKPQAGTLYWQWATIPVLADMFLNLFMKLFYLITNHLLI